MLTASESFLHRTLMAALAAILTCCVGCGQSRQDRAAMDALVPILQSYSTQHQELIDWIGGSARRVDTWGGLLDKYSELEAELRKIKNEIGTVVATPRCSRLIVLFRRIVSLELEFVSARADLTTQQFMYNYASQEAQRYSSVGKSAAMQLARADMEKARGICAQYRVAANAAASAAALTGDTLRVAIEALRLPIKMTALSYPYYVGDSDSLITAPARASHPK